MVGTLYFERTEIPFILPGVNLGNNFNILTNSLSISGCMLCTIITSETRPSLSITKSTVPFPFIGGIDGYLKFLVRNSINCELLRGKNALFTSDSS